MASVFSTGDGSCGIFADTSPCGGGATQAVSFARAAHLLYHTAPTQNARGELVLSFVGIGTIPLELQPMNRAVLREVHGVVVEIAWMGFAFGTPNLAELDRCVFAGQQLEVVQVSPWAGDYTEILLKQIGR